MKRSSASSAAFAARVAVAFALCLPACGGTSPAMDGGTAGTGGRGGTTGTGGDGRDDRELVE